MFQHDDPKSKGTAVKEPDKPADPKKPAETQAPVYTDEYPEYPKLLYNHKTRETAGAKNKDEETKLEGEGYTEDPFEVTIDPAALTDVEIKTLQALLAKAAVALTKLGALQDVEQAKADKAKADQQTKDDKQPPKK